MISFLDESQIELQLLATFQEFGYGRRLGLTLPTTGRPPERSSYADVLLVGRLRRRWSGSIRSYPWRGHRRSGPQGRGTENPSLIENNRRFHRMLVEGVPSNITLPTDAWSHDQVWLIDFDNLDKQRLAGGEPVHRHREQAQPPARHRGLHQRPAAGGHRVEEPRRRGRHGQARRSTSSRPTSRTFPSLFTTNELLVVSDGLEARVGTLTADWERFMPWRTIDGRGRRPPKGMPELEVLLKGVFEQAAVPRPGPALHRLRGRRRRRSSRRWPAITSSTPSTRPSTARSEASSPEGDRRVGVVWHTQGSGKSLTMAFYAGKIIQHPAMAEPDAGRADRPQRPGRPAVRHVLALPRAAAADAGAGRRSRAACANCSRWPPAAWSSPRSRSSCPRRRGTSIPLLSDRRNIVVIADEAHRSQYDFIDGFARHMRDALPNASFIGFTGTPIESTDKNTPAVFGDYIDIYDIQRAVEDGATVRIYYEGRLAKIELERSRAAQARRGVRGGHRRRGGRRQGEAQNQVGRLEAMVGTEKRIEPDRRGHGRAFREAPGCDGRQGDDRLHEPADLRRAVQGRSSSCGPSGTTTTTTGGPIKVVMTGSASDPPEWQPHIRNKRRARGPGQAVQGPGRPVQAGDRPRHVADRLRRAVPAHDVRSTSRCGATG